MKKLAVILLVLALILAAGALYLRLGANLKPISASVKELPASENLSQWATLYVEMSDGTFQGTIVDGTPMGEAEEYVFRTYSIELRNLGIIKAEAITVTIKPGGGDVAIYGEPRLFALPAFSNGTIETTVLSSVNSDSRRAAVVDYYVFGRKMSATVIVE
ncbi:MAG: hypothetical protein LBD16_08760 [Oscillospiraceae bacterium]|nr:hypothetical protein [Oscillospiraceae bacterium]